VRVVDSRIRCYTESVDDGVEQGRTAPAGVRRSARARRARRWWHARAGPAMWGSPLRRVT
jgi:hypothetical protein